MDANETSDAARTAHNQQTSTTGATRYASSARTIAIVALIVAVTAPFWEEALLGSINFHLPMARVLAENANALDRLDHRTAGIEQQLGGTSAQFAKLQTELSQTTALANAAADRASALAMMELAVALRRVVSFDLELAALRATTPQLGDLKPLLDKIEPYAVTGVPGPVRLRLDFARITSRISWSDRSFFSVAWVNRLLPWSRGNAAQPASPADAAAPLLAQARAQLDSNDLAGAVAVVQQIGGQYQDALADWIEDANARVAADIVAQRLSDQITRRAANPVVPAKKAL